MTNIAEGFDRGTKKEFIKFLIIARASASEVKSLLYTALDLEYIDKSVFDYLTNRCNKIKNLI